MSVVWAAFRDRNFEVGEPFLRARSVPSKYCFFRTYASAKRIFLIKSYISPLFSSPISLPFGQISPVFTLYLIFPAFTPYTIHQPIPSPHKITRIIHFFASKLAYIKKEYYLCSEIVAISVLVCDKIKPKQIWNQLKIRLLAR